MQGGSLRNAIPREAQCSFTIANDKVELLQQRIATYLDILKAELGVIETNLALTFRHMGRSPMSIRSISRPTSSRIGRRPR